MQLILTLIENPYAYLHPILEGDTRSWQTLLTLYLSKPKDLWCCWIPANPIAISYSICILSILPRVAFAVT